MTEAYTTVECTGQNGSSSNAATEATDQLVTDINMLYQTMYQVGISQEELDDAITKMSNDSNSASESSWTSNTFMDMIVVMIDDANCVAGGLCFVAGVMNVITDLTNLATIGQNAFLDMCDNVDTAGYDPAESEQVLHDSLSVFNETEFTIYYGTETDKAGQKTSVDGVLNLLSNNSLDDNATGSEAYWGDTGMCPMSASSAASIETSVLGIEDTFTDWDTPESYFTDIISWSESSDEGTTSSDGTEQISTTTSEISDINNGFGEIDTELQTNYTELGNIMSYGMTMYQQMQSAIEEMIKGCFSGYVVSQTGK